MCPQRKFHTFHADDANSCELRVGCKHVLHTYGYNKMSSYGFVRGDERLYIANTSTHEIQQQESRAIGYPNYMAFVHVLDDLLELWLQWFLP